MPSGYNYGGNLSDPFGSTGNVWGLLQGGNPYQTGSATAPTMGANGQALPAWLTSQFKQQTFNTDSESGNEYTNWVLDNSQGGGNNQFKDANGNMIMQLGDPRKWSTSAPSNSTVSAQWLKDPSKVTYDPALGYVTDPNNIGTSTGENRSMEMAALAIFGGGAALSAMGALGAAGAAGEGGAGAAGTGAFDVGGSAGFGGINTLDGLGGVGNLSAADLASVDETGGGLLNNSITNAAAGGSGSGNSLLSNLNSARQTYGNIKTVTNLLGQLTGGGKMPTGTDSSGGAGGGNALGDIGSLLGLLGLGRSGGLYGGGVGTPGGAQQAASTAAGQADPWGQSGQRGQFASLLTPDLVMNSLGMNANGSANVTNNPAYQFELQQGTGAINAGDAAQGTLRSGNRGVELQQMGQGLASKYQMQNQQMGLNSLGTLSSLAGAGGMSSPTAAANATMSGFTGATNLQNSAMNGLFGGMGSGSLNGMGNSLIGLLSKGGSAVSSWLSGLFNGGSPGSNEVLTGGAIGITGDTSGMSGGAGIQDSDVGDFFDGWGAGW